MKNEMNIKASRAGLFLAFSMFATGASGLVFEYILSTVSTYILGNSIEQFSIIIALMLLMMGVAAYIQKNMGDGKLIQRFIALEIALALLGGFSPIAMYAAFSYTETHFVLIQYFFVCSIGFLIGFEIPLALRINDKFAKTLGINISQISAADYVGAFVGAIIWVQLLRIIPITEISFILAGLNILVAIVTLSYFLYHGLFFMKVRHASALLACLALLSWGYIENRDWSISLEQRLYDESIEYSHTTKYQHLVMTHNSSTDEYRFYINGNVQFSSTDEVRYHESLVHPIMHAVSRRDSVLIIGGGDGMALREVLKYREVQRVTLVDLDREMTDFCRDNPIMARLNHGSFGDRRVGVVSSSSISSDTLRYSQASVIGIKHVFMEDDEKNIDGIQKTQRIAKVEIMNIDAAKFVEDIEGKWPVIIIDLPDPNSIELAKLYSKEFYLSFHKLLSPGGMIVIQSTSPYFAKEAFLCIKRTTEVSGYNAIPYHENIPSFGDWGYMMLSDQRHMSLEQMQGRLLDLDQFNVETEYLTPQVFQRQLIFGKGELESVSNDVSTWMNPVIMEKYVNCSWLID